MDTRLSDDPPVRRSGKGLPSAWTGAAVSPKPSFKDQVRSWLPAGAPEATAGASTSRIPLILAIAIFAAAFLVPAWPWLSGHVTIPWDAKSQFFPQVQFLATSIAHGEWPWWTPNVFAGWPQISDPQSLMFSPLHVLLAVFNSAISLRAFDAVIFALSVPRRPRHHPVLPRSRLAHRRRGRGRARLRVRRCGKRAAAAHRPGHQPGVSAADAVASRARARTSVMARRPGGRRDRRIDGDRARPGRAAVALRAGRLRGGALDDGRRRRRSHARQPQAADGGRRERGTGGRRSGRDDGAAGGAIEPARDQLRRRRPPARSIRFTCCSSSSPICSQR